MFGETRGKNTWILFIQTLLWALESFDFSSSLKMADELWHSKTELLRFCLYFTLINSDHVTGFIGRTVSCILHSDQLTMIWCTKTVSYLFLGLIWSRGVLKGACAVFGSHLWCTKYECGAPELMQDQAASFTWFWLLLRAFCNLYWSLQTCKWFSGGAENSFLNLSCVLFWLHCEFWGLQWK